MGRVLPIIGWITLMVVIVFLAVCLNDFFSKWGGAVSVCIIEISIVLWILQYYYFKSEKFYLWCQRQLLRFKKTDAKWNFTVSYEGIPENNHPDFNSKEFSEQIFKLFCDELGPKVKIDDKISAKIKIRTDIFKFTLEFDEHQRIYLATEHLLIPVHRNKHFITLFVRIFEKLERKILAKEVMYRVHLIYSSKNPYFGFFLKHLSMEQLNDFHCSFVPDSSKDSLITVTKNEIVIDTKSYHDLYILVLDYLSLSTDTITGVCK